MISPLAPFTRRTRIAYFTMEVALRPEMHTYAGGLGVLAGDTVRSCADLELPVVFVSLLSRAGYFRQEIDPERGQIEHPDPWEPAKWAQPLAAMIGVQIEGRDVWVRPWLYVHKRPRGNRFRCCCSIPTSSRTPARPQSHQSSLWRRRGISAEAGAAARHRRLPLFARSASRSAPTI